MNIKSLQDEVCGSRWLGCDISGWKPWTVVRDSSCVPSIVVLFLVQQTEDLTLKSSKIMVNKELQELVSLKTFSKFDKKFSNWELSWLGDLYTTPTQPLQFCIETSQNVFTKT